MVGIGEAELGHLADVERSLAGLAGRLTAAVHAAGGATGADAAGVVGVALDASGRISGVTLTQGWRRLVGAAGLTGAVQEASQAAGAEFTRRLKDATTAGPTQVGGAAAQAVPPASVATTPTAVSPGLGSGLTSLREVIDAVAELRIQLAELQSSDDAGGFGAAGRDLAGRDPAGRVEALVAQGVLQQVTLIDDWWSGASDEEVSLAVTRAIVAAYTASDQGGAQGILNGRTYRELSAVLSDPLRLASLFTPPARRNPW